jgi:hypothetical protein
MNRQLLWGLDAAMTAHLRPGRTVSQQLSTLLSPRSFGYDRVAAAVNCVDRIIPGTARRVASLICRPMELPFEAAPAELLAFGSGATVFLAGDRVVKIYRRTLGVPRRRLPDLLEQYRQKYEEMRRLYLDAPGVVWPAEYAIVGGPILSRPAVACIQEFIPGLLRDFFTDLTEDQLREAMDCSPELRRQVVAFAEATLDLHRREGRCPDLAGHCNLAVAGEGREARLCLIDYGLKESHGFHGLERMESVALRFSKC